MKKSIIIALIFCVPFISLSNVENNQQEIKPVNLNEPKLPEEKPLKPEFEIPKDEFLGEKGRENGRKVGEFIAVPVSYGVSVILKTTPLGAATSEIIAGTVGVATPYITGEVGSLIEDGYKAVKKKIEESKAEKEEKERQEQEKKEREAANRYIPQYTMAMPEWKRELDKALGNEVKITDKALKGEKFSNKDKFLPLNEKEINKNIKENLENKNNDEKK